MNRRRVILVLAVVLVVAGLWWLLRAPQPEPTPQAAVAASTPPERATATATAEAQASPAPQTEAELLKKAATLVEKALQAPISFYGKVVDQNGDPVPDARVGYSALDKFMAPGTGYRGKSDENGLFSITGISGARLSVNVRKEGYYFIDGKSNASFAYGTGSDGHFREPPTKDNPAVFVLHKMGETEPLVRVEKNARIPKDGTPVTVNLSNGRVAPDGNLRVEAWTDDQNLNEQRRYNWRCRITVPGGGLVERKGQFNFEAPADGYEESVELGMPEDAEQWTPQQQRDYFVKLPDGRFARVSFTMIAGGNHYFLLESFLNPSGSRNLEYDAKQTAATP